MPVHTFDFVDPLPNPFLAWHVSQCCLRLRGTTPNVRLCCAGAHRVLQLQGQPTPAGTDNWTTLTHCVMLHSFTVQGEALPHLPLKLLGMQHSECL